MIKSYKTVEINRRKVYKLTDNIFRNTQCWHINTLTSKV